MVCMHGLNLKMKVQYGRVFPKMLLQPLLNAITTLLLGLELFFFWQNMAYASFFGPDPFYKQRISHRLTPVYTEGKCEAPLLKKNIIALCPQVYIVD